MASIRKIDGTPARRFRAIRELLRPMLATFRYFNLSAPAWLFGMVWGLVLCYAIAAIGYALALF